MESLQAEYQSARAINVCQQQILQAYADALQSNIAAHDKVFERMCEMTKALRGHDVWKRLPPMQAFIGISPPYLLKWSWVNHGAIRDLSVHFLHDGSIHIIHRNQHEHISPDQPASYAASSVWMWFSNPREHLQWNDQLWENIWYWRQQHYDGEFGRAMLEAIIEQLHDNFPKAIPQPSHIRCDPLTLRFEILWPCGVRLQLKKHEPEVSCHTYSLYCQRPLPRNCFDAQITTRENTTISITSPTAATVKVLASQFMDTTDVMVPLL